MSGYRVKNLDSLNSESICPSCRLLLRDPLQTVECGHRLCRSCVEKQDGDVVICPKCATEVPKGNLKPDRGFANDLQRILIICWFCDWSGLLKDYPGHLVQKHPNPICSYCDQCFSNVFDFDQHQLYHCEKSPVFCPLKSLGCQEMMTRATLPAHYRSKQHQLSLMNSIFQMKSSIDSPHMTQEDIVRLQQIDQSLGVLSNGVDVLSEDQQRITAESINHHQVLDNCRKDFTKFKALNEDQNAVVNQITAGQHTTEEDLRFVWEKINQTKATSPDGTLLWRIDQFAQKIADARSGNQRSIYSPDFNTSSTGYKLCLELYLNGDKNAEGSHMSLYLVLKRSEYDPILKFPFDYQIIFALLDQTNQQKHIVNVLKPNASSPSFQRPRSDVNVASGISKFVPLELLRQANNPYIRDDTIFIKAIVDFENIPNNLFTYACSISPAFSALHQHELIQEECNKRRR